MSHHPLRWPRLGLASLCAAALVAQAQQGGDLQARILYAFHAEDTNQLANLIQTLATRMQSGGGDAALRYHLAHAEYRLGLLSDASQGPAAGAAFTACTDQLKTLLREDVKSPEVLALQSACDMNLARFRRFDAALLRARARDSLRAAARLAPRNPRVVYLEAEQALAQSAPGSVEQQRAVAQLELAAALFEESSATSIDVPGWGHAEAYLELGRQLASRGDVVGARNWIEKALIAAPDYKAAQRQLAALVHR
jgi:tetratricopeptide (TPR) repeat protein